jgi:MFS family permease
VRAGAQPDTVPRRAPAQEAVVYYAPRLLRMSGLHEIEHVMSAVTFVGVVKTIAILVGAMSFDRIGRRTMLMLSAAGQGVALLGLWAFGTSAGPVFVTFSLCVYMASFSLGFSPLTYVVTAELLPLGLRARGMAAAIFLQRFVAGVIASCFISLQTFFGEANIWLFFSFFALVAFIFVAGWLPETRGHSLEEIAALFAEPSHKEPRLSDQREHSDSVSTEPPEVPPTERADPMIDELASVPAATARSASGGGRVML